MGQGRCVAAAEVEWACFECAVIVLEYSVNYTELYSLRVERFPRFLYRSRFTEQSPLLSHKVIDLMPCRETGGGGDRTTEEYF